MRMIVDLTQEKGFRVKTGQNVFLCDRAAQEAAKHPSLTPMEMFIASLGSSFASAAISFCEERSLSFAGLQVMLDWEYAKENGRLSRIDIAVHMPESITPQLEDDFMSAIHACEIYKTLLEKPEIHCHATVDLEKAEGESLLHFVGAE